MSQYNVVEKNKNIHLIKILFLLNGLLSAWPYMFGSAWYILLLFPVTTIFYVLVLKEIKIPLKLYFPVFIWLLWSLFLIVIGVFIAEGYWELKSLYSNALALFLPIIIYLFYEPRNFIIVYSFWRRYFLVFFLIVFIPFCPHNQMSIFLQPLLIALLFIRIIPRSRVLLLLLLISLLMIDLDVRANIIRICAFTFIGIVFYSKRISKRILQITVYSLLFLPFLFLTFGLLGIFNIFDTENYFKEDYTFKNSTADGIADESWLADPRTFWYREAVISSIKNNYFVWGNTPAKGYDSEVFGEIIGESIGKLDAQRTNSEVGILGIFTWLGIIGVLFYFMIFLSAIQKALYKSSNRYIKIIAVSVAFMWCFTWIENTIIVNILNIVIYTLLGMCYSPKFRSMNNREFRLMILYTFSYAKRKQLIY